MNITAQNDGDGITRLIVAGELDMETAGALEQHVTGILSDAHPRRLIIDATDVRFCDSSGIHALLRARDSAHRHGAAFVLCNPVGVTRRTLEITGLLDSLTTVSQAEPQPRPNQV
jgi:anti-sigma B factor antagonist